MVNTQHTRRRLRSARTPGQSLPLLGLMLVIIVAMVGLSADVGNTFSEERRAVTAANTAALAGMNMYINRSATTTNGVIYRSIVNSLKANGVEVAEPGAEPAPGELELRAMYLDAQGRPITTGSPFITNDTNRVPGNVAFVQVSLNGRVDTNFARVVGRNDLPISALSHAGTCTNQSGVYPLTVSNQVIDGDRFIEQSDPDLNWRVIQVGDLPGTEDRYVGFTAMRLVVSGNTTPGNFSWLRWRDSIPGARSEVQLARSLTGEGNLGEGFEEAPWPTPQNQPEVYPEQPGVLNEGDWVWGDTGLKNSNDVRAAMDEHMRVGTRMILPIHSTAIGAGAESRFHIVRLGLFLLLEKGQTQNDHWYDMVFLGDPRPQSKPCLYTGVIEPNTEGVVELLGSVSLWPEYQFRPQERRPIQYVVVLDVSGSMSANFAGQCDVGSGTRPARGWWQCTNGPAGAPQVEVTGTGPTYYWNNVDERRITVAKRALESLVRSTNMPGNAEYTTARPPDQMALVWFTHIVPSGNTRGFSNNPTTIINNINAAGWRQYQTEGGTNGAAGLLRAARLLGSAPRSVTENGRTWEYKRVVVFITDGVSNQLLDPNRSDLRAGSSDQNTYPTGHSCRTPLVVEMANCQTTDIGGRTIRSGRIPAGLDRPITQAVNVSREQLQANGVEVFSVALSNIPDTGLRDGIASFPSYYFSAADLERDANGRTNVDAIMQAINTQVENGICEPRADAAWTNVIPETSFQSVGGLIYPNVGEVILTDQSTGTEYRAPIRADRERGGALSYRFDRLPAGTYRLQPYLFYRHPLDPPNVGPRRYSLIYQGDTTASDIVITVAPNTSVGSFTQTQRQDLQLRLFGDVCAS